MHFLIALILPIVFFPIMNWFYGQTKKERMQDDFVQRTKAPMHAYVTSLVGLIVMSIIFIGIPILLVLTTQPEDRGPGMWVALIFSLFFLWSLFFVLFLVVSTCYESIFDEYIIVHRGFKKKIVRFDEMAEYTYTEGFKQLVVDDRDGKCLFYVADNRVGIGSLVKSLDSHGVPRKTPEKKK